MNERSIEEEIHREVEKVVDDRLRAEERERQAAERRRYERVACRFVGVLVEREPPREVLFYLENFSSGGVFVRTEAPSQVGGLVKLVFREAGGREVRALGVVRWTAGAGDEGGAGMGIEFLDVDDEENREVMAILRDRLTDREAWLFPNERATPGCEQDKEE
ncbi:MAG: PilZ domain-containing protein [Planctomycetes bacterium]|nr:PilZ domain-containing protein [Planctomycetota bacterium]